MSRNIVWSEAVMSIHSLQKESNMAFVTINGVICLKCPTCHECIDSCDYEALKCTIKGFPPYIF